MFSFFKSYYVDDTAFILSQPRRVIAPLHLSSHFRFGLTIHTGSKRKGGTRNGGHSFRGLDRNHRLLIWRTSKSTPTALCPLHQVQILRILLRRNSMTQQTSLNGSAGRKLFGSMNKQLLGNKNTDRYPSQALSSDCCEYSTLGERKLGTENR
jgi:hypothetical protein